MKTDLQLLQGSWRQVRFEEDEVVDPIDTHGAHGAIMTISGTTFHVATRGEFIIRGNFELDCATLPKRIDWIDSTGKDAGMRLPAIYTISEATFEFAAADADMQRPQDFAGGKGITIRGFVRS